MPVQRKASTVFVVDERELRRAGIEGLLRGWAEAHGIGLLAMLPAEAIAASESASDCRLIVLSVGLQSIGARENAQWIRVMRALAPQAPVVIVSDNDNPAEVIAALSAGVQGFVPTNMGQELALQAFSFILAGGSYFPPSAIRNAPIAQAPDREPGGGGRTRSTDPAKAGGTQAGAIAGDDEEPEGTEGAVAALTHRQSDVLQLLKSGEPNKVIARRLGMTEATVKVHVRHIMRKLGASNRTQAALNASMIEGAPEREPQLNIQIGDIHRPGSRLWAAE